MKPKGFVKRKVTRSGSGMVPERSLYTVRTLSEEEKAIIEEKKQTIQSKPQKYVNDYKKAEYAKYGPVSPTFTIGEDGIARQR